MKKLLLPALWLLTVLMLCLCVGPAAVYADGENDETQWLKAEPVSVTSYDELAAALPEGEKEPDEDNIIWIDVARMDADITVGEGQDVHSRGVLQVPSGRTLTIDDGGRVQVSFQVENGGKIIVKNGGTLETTMGDDCHIDGQVNVEAGGTMISQMGSSIIVENTGKLILDGIFRAGGYQNMEQVNNIWFENKGAVSGSGFIVVSPVAMMGGDAGVSAQIDVASKARQQLGENDEIKVLIPVATSAALVGMSETQGVEGVILEKDITIGDGQEPDNMWTVLVPRDRTLTIEDGGSLAGEFQVDHGGKLIVKSGGALRTAMGGRCHNKGTLIVEDGGTMESRMGSVIINDEPGRLILDGVFTVGSYQDDECHMWFENSGSIEGGGFIEVAPTQMDDGDAPFPARVDVARQAVSALGQENDVLVLVPAGSFEELQELIDSRGKLCACLTADITVGDGQTFDTRGMVIIPDGVTVTIGDGGDWTSSFYIEDGGKMIVEAGGAFGTTMGRDCHNEGLIQVELGGSIQSRFGTAIINDDTGRIRLDGLFSVGGYQDENKVNHIWYGNTGSIEGVGFIVAGALARAEGDGMAAKLDAASKIKATLAQGCGVRVLVTAMDSAEMKQLNETNGVDGFMLNTRNPYEDEPEGGGSEPKFFVIEDSMDTTGKVVYNIGDSVIINPGVSFTTDCYLSTSNVIVQGSTLTVNGKFIANELTVGDTLIIGDNADIVVQKLLFSWPSKPCEVKNVTGEVHYGAMYDQNDGSEAVSMNESKGGKFYIPANPTRDGYTFAGWKITSGWQGSSVWTNAMDTALSGMQVKTDSRGTYVEESGLFPLSIIAQWTKPSATDEFTDVKNPKHPYYNAIYWAAGEGITKGYKDGSFGIDRSCTRGEMIMFLWRFAKKPAPESVSKSPFKDVPMNHTFFKAILWAYQTGVTKGYSDGTFGINRSVSRGECMMFLWRVKNKPAPDPVTKSPFKDVPTNHSFYKAILWGSQNGITKGYTTGSQKGNFGINDNCTRGQIVTFLYRAK